MSRQTVCAYFASVILFGAAPALAQTVQSITLIDTSDDSGVSGFDPLPQNAVLNISDLPAGISFRMNTSPTQVGSVQIKLFRNGTIIWTQTENILPYAMFGDDFGAFVPWTTDGGPQAGASYTLEATAFSEPRARGTASIPLIRNFSVIEDEVEGGLAIAALDLIDADSDTVLQSDYEGGTLNLSLLPNLSIEAIPTNDPIKQVRFYLDDVLIKIESIVPYAIAGDGSSGNDYFAWNPPLGNHTLNVVPIRPDNSAGTSKSILLNIIDDQGTDNQAPLVSAGPDRNLPDPGETTLNGTVTDDGLPTGVLDIQWSQTGGPTDADIATATSAVTDVFLPEPGTYTFELSAFDGELTTTDSVNINVFEGDGGPSLSFLALVNSGSTTLESPFTGGTLNVAELPTFTIEAIPNGQIGSAEFRINGDFFRTENISPYVMTGDSGNTYTPWEPGAGDYTITVTPFSGTNRSGEQGTSITIAVTIVDLDLMNDPPVANDISVTTQVNSSVNFALSASDDENHDLEYIFVDLPDHGDLSGAAPNLNYDPNNNYVGPDAFSFFVRETNTPEALESDVATVSITVQEAGPGSVAIGAYPDINLDSAGNVHLVYARGSKVYYKKYLTASQTWTAEEDTGISSVVTYQNDPDIVVDSSNRPHVVGGQSNTAQYAFKNASGNWVVLGHPNFNRDTEVQLDSNDNAFIIDRGGNHGGHVGLFRHLAGTTSLTCMPFDPDIEAGFNPNVVTSDHVYGDLFIDAFDTLHISIRHAGTSQSPGNHIGYIRTNIAGNDVIGSLLFGQPEKEAPHVIVTPSQDVLVSNYDGRVYDIQDNGAFVFEDRPISCGERDQPEMSVGPDGHVYISCFGGKYSVREPDGDWLSGQVVPSITGESRGFMETIGASGFSYTVWEEDNSVNHKNGGPGSPRNDDFDIIFGTISTSGQIGG